MPVAVDNFCGALLIPAHHVVLGQILVPTISERLQVFQSLRGPVWYYTSSMNSSNPGAGLTVVLLGVLAAVSQACSNRDAVKNEAQRRIDAELAKRDDIAPADRAAAAEAIAADMVDTTAELAAAQSQVDADNAALDQRLVGAEGAKARECAQLQLELDTLRRLQSERSAVDEAQLADIQAAILRTESRQTDLCSSS